METSVRGGAPPLWLPELMRQVSKQQPSDAAAKKKVTSEQEAGSSTENAMDKHVSPKLNHVASAPIQADNGKNMMPYSMDTLLKWQHDNTSLNASSSSVLKMYADAARGEIANEKLESPDSDLSTSPGITPFSSYNKSQRNTSLYECQVCNKTFPRLYSLERHELTHTERKPFKCSVCQKGFSWAGNLSTHMRIHTGEKPFSCAVCGKAFSDKSVLNRHKKRHMDGRPFHVRDKKKPEELTVFDEYMLDQSVLQPMVNQSESHSAVDLSIPQTVEKDLSPKPDQHGVSALNSDSLFSPEISELSSECDEPGGKSDSRPPSDMKPNKKRSRKSSPVRYQDPSEEVDLSYQCVECDDRFLDAEALATHMNAHATNSEMETESEPESLPSISPQDLTFPTLPSSFVCTRCDASFQDQIKLNAHIKQHLLSPSVKPPIFQCERCDTKFPDRFTLKAHIKTHEEVPFTCTACNVQFAHSSEFVEHMKSHADKKSRNVKPRDTFTPPVITPTSEAIPTTLELLNDTTPCACDVCGKVVAGYNALQRHLRGHTGERAHKCGVCDKQFARADRLNRHMRIHTGEKPFKCNICSKAFARLDNLNSHIRIHTGDKPHACSFCPKRFILRSDLVKHMRVHTGEKHTGGKPFMCIICNEQFAEKTSLVAHMRTHVDARPFSCVLCSETFADRGQYNRHMKEHGNIQVTGNGVR